MSARELFALYIIGNFPGRVGCALNDEGVFAGPGRTNMTVCPNRPDPAGSVAPSASARERRVVDRVLLESEYFVCFISGIPFAELHRRFRSLDSLSVPKSAANTPFGPQFSHSPATEPASRFSTDMIHPEVDFEFTKYGVYTSYSPW